MRDGEQPGAKGPAAIGGQRNQGAREDETGGILGLLPVTEPAIAIAVDRRQIAGVEATKGLPVAERSRDQRRVAGLVGEECWLASRQMRHRVGPIAGALASSLSL